jgi:hypothetical protein
MIRSAILAPILIACAAFASACGDDEPAQDIRGEAAVATAQFWVQELNGNVLPEGQTVIERGTQDIVELEAGDGAQARVCVEFMYTHAVDPFPNITRVYVATKADDAWTFEVVNPDGTCEGVS